MDVVAYAVCYNEAQLLPYYIRHYQSFCSKVVIYDNYSNDGSKQIARSMGAEVRLFGNSQLDDREYLKIKNNCWKGSGADFIIVGDLDEFIYHPDIVNHLKWCKSKKIALPSIEGYNIYSEITPTTKGQIYEQIRTGFYDKNFSKQAIFSPKIKEINFGFGCHTNRAKGVKGGKMYLLHYRCIGGVQDMINRHRMYAMRMCDFNKQRKFGAHYFRNKEQLLKEWQKNINLSKELLFLSNETPDIQSYQETTRT
ncbi:MAG TPA: hypothetical protein ENH82_13395 [bacterium]|nr:hypothetical protein [bacterium]